MPHAYVSTACYHDQCTQCRNTCKFCNAPCRCEHHAEDLVEAPVSWLDQARQLAIELFRYAERVPVLHEQDWPGISELLTRAETDPALFWLRGEEQPPGVWHPEGGDAP
jgi:hypothetical protein